MIEKQNKKSVKPTIELTADGSHTLFVSELDEHYHSVNGAVQESNHVFIDAGLRHCGADTIHVFEIGFGTGLNALLTAINAGALDKIVHYTTVEAYPLPWSVVSQLNYAELDRNVFEKIHMAEWGVETEITPNFYIKKIEGDFTTLDLKQIVKEIDLIYFDAFAPDKQPDMWTQELFDNLYNICAHNAILVTYCAKGVVRRMLQQAGYTTERLPGPPGKREMLRATK